MKILPLRGLSCIKYRDNVEFFTSLVGNSTGDTSQGQRKKSLGLARDPRDGRLKPLGRTENSWEFDPELLGRRKKWSQR